MHIKVNSLEEALVTTGKELLSKGIARATRGFDCWELPEPVMVTINDPTQRYIFNKDRGWNKYLGFAESLWLMNGVNHMEFVGKVVKNLYNFSDDGQFMRAGYGPRIRAFSGISDDYRIDKPYLKHVQNSTFGIVDQLKYVVDLLKSQLDSRQASITIHDPVKDCFASDGSMKQTKDQPCTRLIQFMVVDGKLDATTYMRSNDFLWGFSAVNIFNFTLLQEVVANLIGVPVGRYHHVANNLHYYANFKEKIEKIVDTKLKEFNSYHYDFKGVDLPTFDALLMYTYDQANQMANNKNPYYEIQEVGLPMLDDMLKVISRRFQGVQEYNSRFDNPIIQELFNE